METGINNIASMPPNREMMRLRDMLYERGIKYNKSETDAEKFTYWEHEGRCWGYCVDCIGDTSLTTIDVTPEQAIAATVGAGTCHLEEREHEREIPNDLPDCDGGWYTEVTHDCDECGYENADPNIRFCGGCGRKVVAE